MNIVIPAGGDGKRWNDFLGTRKQFAPVNGEMIIERLIRLFSDLGHMYFVTKPGYELTHPNVTSVYTESDLEMEWLDIAKVASTVPYWSHDDVTLILLGDVYWTEEGAETVKKYVDKRQWFMYGRLTRSNVKKHHPSNENFAMSFWPEDHKTILKAMNHSVDLVDRGEIRWNKMSQLYRILCGKDGAQADYSRMPQQNLGNFIAIDDYTDDVDWRDDILDLWKTLKTKEYKDNNFTKK